MTNVNKPIGKAPYNFVPLPEKIVTRYDSIADLPTHNASHKEDANLLSGEITFEIVAENPFKMLTVHTKFLVLAYVVSFEIL